MTRHFIIAAACLSIVLTIGCQVGQVATPKAHWSFDEGSGTEVAGGGKIKGGLKWAEGKSGKALEFNGAGYVLVPHSPCFHSPTHTVAAWVNLKSTGDYQYIAWKAGPVFPEAEYRRRIDIWVHMDGYIEGLVDVAGADRTRVTGSVSVADGKWHLVAWVYDGKSAKLYVDGKLDVEEQLSGPLAKNEFPLWIGARPGDVAATGSIDEFRYFDRVLSEEEITAIFESGK